MRTCIYLKKSEPEVSFCSKEHIVPAGIGGMMTLDYGIVSDEANKKFSSLELDFIRNSPISLPRQFFGPGKRGKLAILRASKSNIHIMNDDKGNTSLGYIQLGKPHQIPQLIVEADNSVKMIFDASAGSIGYQKQLEEFKRDLKDFNGVYMSIDKKEFDDVQLIIGYLGGKWYIARNENMDDEKLNSIILKISNINFEITAPPLTHSSQITSIQHMAFSHEYFFRVCSKMVFNFLAYANGPEFVFRDIFDPIRNWITNGGENVFANLIDPQDSAAFKKLPFPSEAHTILIMPMGTKLVGFVGLYGNSFSVVISICNDFKEYFGLNGWICDWRNKRENFLEDYIGSMYRDSMLHGADVESGLSLF